MLKPVEELIQKVIRCTIRIPEQVAAAHYILGIDLLQPLYEVFFTAILGLTNLFWGLDAILLYIAYMLHNLRIWLVMSFFSPILNMFVGEGGTLVGVIRGSFLIAVMVLGLTYIARVFFQFNLVDPQKLFLWGGIVVIFVGTGAATTLYQGLESVREDLSGYLYGAIFQQFRTEEGLAEIANSFNAPGAPAPHVYGPTERGGVAPIVGYPSLDPNDPSIRGYNIAGAFLRATMDDVLNPWGVGTGNPVPLPVQYEKVKLATSFYVVYWHGQMPAELSRLEDQFRAPMVVAVIEGLIRMIFGIIPCILAVLEAVILLCLTIATGIIFVTLPVALIFAFFEPLSPMATGMIKQYTSIFMKTMVINVLFAVVLLLVIAAAYVGNPIVLIAGTILGVFFGFNFAKDSVSTIVDAANAFTTGVGQAVGLRKPFGVGTAAGGVLGSLARRTAGAAKSTGQAVARGALGWAATGDARYGVGAMLGSNRALYSLATAGEAMGMFGRRPSAGLTAAMQGMRATGMAGGKPFSPASMLQTYQTRQMARAETAGARYKSAFEQYQRQLWAQRAKFQETGKKEDEPAIDRQARLWTAWQESPSYDAQGRPILRTLGEDGKERVEMISPPQMPEDLQQLMEDAQQEVDRPFMGGFPGRGFASTIPRPTTKGLPSMGDLFPRGATEAAVAGARGGPGGAPPPGAVGPLGGRMIGHASAIPQADAVEALRSGFALSPGTDGQVEAIPVSDIMEPEQAFVRPAATVDDPREMLLDGWSVMMTQDGESYVCWQQEKDLDPGVQAAQSLTREAREATQRMQAAGMPPGAVLPGSPASRLGLLRSSPRMTDAAPAIPGTAQAAGRSPTPESCPEDCAELSTGLADVVREAFREVRLATPRPSGSLARSAVADQMVEEYQSLGLPQIATENYDPDLPQDRDSQQAALLRKMRGPLGEAFTEAFREMREAGMAEEDISRVVYQPDGRLRPAFAQELWERAEGQMSGSPSAAGSQLVGRTPEAEQEFAVTELLGELAHHPDADLVRVARTGAAAWREGGPDPIAQILENAPLPGSSLPQALPEGATIASVEPGIYQVGAAVQSVAAAGASREEAVPVLERAVGISAESVFDAMQRRDDQEAVSVVQTAEAICHELLARGMDSTAVVHAVYTPDGQDIRPEFLNAVVARAEGGASSFMDSEEGIEDLKLLIAAGLGMEKEVSAEAIAQAIASSAVAPGPAGAGATDVAQRLYIPESALENATPSIQGLAQTAQTYQLDQADIAGMVRAAQGGLPDPAERAALEQRVRDTLRDRGHLAEPGVEETMRTLRGLASNVPARVRAPRTFSPEA